ncbi:MAG: MFS transporter [Actinomycetota bacterium]
MSTAPLSPTDRKALVAVGAQFLVNGLILSSFLPRLPELRDRAGLSIGELGFALTSAGLAGIAASLVVGRVIARFGTRTVIIAGGFGLCGALALMGVASSPLLFVIALGGMSFCDLIVDIAMNLQGSWLSARRSTPVMNRLHGLWSLGTVIGAAIAAQLSAFEVPITAHFVVAALVFSVIVATIGRSLLRADEGTDDDIAAAEADDEAVEGAATRWIIIRLAIAGAAAFLLEQTTADWSAVRLSDDLDASSGVAASGFVAFTIGMFLGRASGDLAHQRLGAERLRNVAIALALTGLPVAFLAPSAPLALAGFVLGGTGVATLLPRIYDEAAQIPGSRRTGLAAMTGATRVTGLFGPAVVGLLASSALSVGAAVTTVIAAAGVVFVVVTRRPMS